MDTVLGLVALTAGCGIGLVGLLVVFAGLLGFVQGIHGGALAAGLMVLFGGAMSFAGFYGARYGYRVVCKREPADRAAN